MKPATAMALSVVAAFAFLTTASEPVLAANQSFTLFGDSNGGWGTSATSITQPGPTLTVDEGDNVTLTLDRTDAAAHRWFIDYDDDSTDDSAEPNSPSITSQVVWNFTADRNGTFTYRCRNHPSTMSGSIVIRAATSGGLFPWLGDLNTLLGLIVIVVVGVAVLVYLLHLSKQTPR